MITHGCQSVYSAIAFVRIFQRLWRYIGHLYRRYEKWKEMRYNYDQLLRMEDRLLKDIGLSRAEAVGMTQGHNFWKYIFRPEDNVNTSFFRPERKCNRE